MATEVIYSVGAGKTYSTPKNALDAVPADITATGTPQIAVIEIDAGTYTESVWWSMPSKTTDVDHYIHIRPAAGHEHNGVFGAGVILSSGSSDTINCLGISNLKISDVEIKDSGRDGLIYRTNGGTCTLERVIASGVSSDAIRADGGGTVNAYDCIAKTSTVGFYKDNDSTLNAYNCTAVDNSTGFYFSRFNGTASATNCLSAGNSVDDFGMAGGDPLTLENNASSDLTGNITGIAATTDYDATTFKPTKTGALYRAGKNLNTELVGGLTDITGDTRAYWDIGAFAADTFESTIVATAVIDPAKQIDGGDAVATQQDDMPQFVDLANLPAAFHNRVSAEFPYFTFTGADNDPIPDAFTVASGAFDIQGNQLEADRTQASIAVVDHLSDFALEGKITVNTGGTNDSAGFVFRYTDPSNFLYVFIDVSDNRLKLAKFVAGVYSIINSSDFVAVGNGTQYTIRLNGIGSSLNASIDGAVTVGATDSFNLTATKHGLRSPATNTKYTDFSLSPFGRSAGSDIRVFRGAKELPREVVSYDPITKTGELHTKLDFLSATSFTPLTIHCDGTSSDYAVTDPMGRNACWSDYAGVYHLEGNGATQTDATGGGLDLTATSTTDATGFNGVSGGGLSFNGTTSKLLSTAGAAVGNNSSISAWATSTDNSAQREIAGVSNSSSTATLRRIGNDAGDYWSQHRSEAGLTPGESFSGVTPTTSYDFIAGRFFTSGGKFASQVSVNGAAYSTVGLANSNTVTSNENQTEIGVLQAGSPIQFYSGSIDEVRFRSGLTTEDWLATEYKNQAFNDEYFDYGTDSATLTHVSNITIPAAQVDADLTDFPWLSVGSQFNSELWAAASATGGDLRFYKSGGVIELPREVVSYDNSAETAEVWTKYLGTLSSTTDTVVEVYAGAAGDYPVSSYWGRNNVWSDYEFVWHGEDGLVDATGTYTLTATGTPTAVAGKIGNAGDGLSATDFYTTNTDFNYEQGYTIQGWGKKLADDAGGTRIIGLGDSTNTSTGRQTHIGHSGGSAQLDVGNFELDSSAITVNVWSMMHGVVRADADRELYHNGATAGTDTRAAGTGVVFNSDRISVGASADSSAFGQALDVDEARMIKATLSADWISTEYNNQSAPATFSTFAAPGGAGIPGVPTLSAPTVTSITFSSAVPNVTVTF